MYGSVFDAKHNALYSLGYMRGHLYRYSLDDRSVKDLGKVTEGGCFRMVIGPDGNIYTSSKSGYLFKVDTKTQKIIDMNFRVPMHFYGDNYTCENSFGIFSEAKVGPDGRIYFAIMYGPDILALDTKTGEIENLGPFIPTDRYAVTENRNGVFGIDFDSKGVMWYFVNPVSDGSEPEQPAQPSSLFRWDVLNGGKPQWAGILGCPDRIPTCASKLFIHDDHIMVVDTNHGSKPAAVVTIDLREFDPEGYALVDPETLNDPMFHLNDEEQFGYSRMFDDQGRFMAANPHTFAGNGGELCGAVRLWRALAPDHIDDSNVAALAWDDENGLNGICGTEQKYGFRIVGDELDFITELEKLDKEYAAWLEEAVKPVEFTGTGTLPGYPGRQYKAVPTACAELTEGRQFVGTLDGMAAVCKGDKAYSVGMCGYNGPVRAAASTPDKKVVYGVAGDESDFGMVFRYDDENGLQLLGDIKHSSSRTPYGYITCNVLSACAISKDGSYLAIGSADRMGTVLIYKLK